MMKSKNTYILLASVLMLASSCQKETGLIENGNDHLSFSVSYASANSQASTKGGKVEFTDENGNPAPFTINLSVEDTKVEPLTKGTPINNLDKFVSTFDAFRAWGWAKSGSNWTDVWNSGDGTKVKQIEYGSTEYRPVDGSDNFIKAYDPAAVAGGQYSFYAIAPYDLSGTGVTPKSCTYDKLTFTYTSPGGAGGTTDAELQKEVLAGYMASGAKLTKDVPLTFTPALAAIRFKVSKEQLGRDVTIKSIELHTLSATGTCKVSNTGVEWSDLGTQDETFKQTFNFYIDHEDLSGPDINDANLTKTFFIIPQTGKSDVSGGEPTGTRIVINYCEKGSTEEKKARHLLFGKQFEAGKTYIYNIGNFEGDALKMEPWVEFSTFDVNDNNLVKGENLIHEENNAKFMFDFTQQGGTYEKTYFKVHNLEVDHWYSIEFTENLSLKGRTTTPFGNVGAYACRVHKNMNKDKGGYSMIVFRNGNANNYDRYDTDANPPFVWQHPDGKYNSTDYTSLLSKGETAKITFKATAEMMYWVWDYSRGLDNRTLKAEIYMPYAGQTITCTKYDGSTRDVTFTTGEKIKDITPEADVPTVDFLNATLYNTNCGYINQGNSSNKSYAVDATAGTVPVSGTLVFRFVYANGDYPRVNIPLLNLDPSKKYRITYTVDKTGAGYRTGTNYRLGCIVRASAVTGNNVNLTTEPGYQNFTGENKANDFNFTKSFEFTPSAATMYWVWDFSEFNDGTSNHHFITFSNVTIEELEP